MPGWCNTMNGLARVAVSPSRMSWRLSEEGNQGMYVQREYGPATIPLLFGGLDAAGLQLRWQCHGGQWEPTRICPTTTCYLCRGEDN